MVGVKFFALASALSAVAVFAQPGAVPTTTEAPCQETAGTDEVSIPMDSGFVGIFNGTDLKGWWNNCHGEDANHSNTTKGGIYKADPTLHAIYTQQRATTPGGSALCTNKKYGNQEIIVEYWADFGNDAGIYHRTTEKVLAYQTVLDYKPDNCIGGSYPQEMENAGNPFYNCSYKFGASETAPFSGTQGNAGIANKATLVQADMYDPNGWNELRTKVWGNPPHHQAWMRKLGGAKWIQTLDVTWPGYYLTPIPTATGYTALQVHGNGYWNKTILGDWYRNIRVRELDANGNPIPPTTSLKPRLNPGVKVSLTSAGLAGWLDRDYAVKVTDVNGKLFEAFPAHSGNFTHSFSKGSPRGITFVHLIAGAQSRVIRAVPL
ncbi:MAG: hypothetical protein JWO30_3027 [Fibrobacteres bacterium]|nr:hypothetical protein [Fibrobacterota bacterium]